jgi:hypothetical protein
MPLDIFFQIFKKGEAKKNKDYKKNKDSDKSLIRQKIY